MAVICPTVTPLDTHEYRTQMEVLEPFAKRVHLDFMDGQFAPTLSPKLEQAWWNKPLSVDIHLMYKQPTLQLPALLQLKPSLVIVHAEAEGNFLDFAKQLQIHNIKVGVALLAETPVAAIAEVLKDIDHVLIFSGHLGFFGGKVDLGLLEKAKQLKTLRPDIELGWDGGISIENAAALVAGGIDVLNVGGAIQKANNPEEAYQALQRAIESV